MKWKLALIAGMAACLVLVFSLGRGSKEIDLESALADMEAGRYTLVVVSSHGERRFVSFQRSSREKRQVFYETADEGEVLARLAASLESARANGWEINTMGLDD